MRVARRTRSMQQNGSRGLEGQGSTAAALGQGMEYTAQLRAGQAADPELLDASKHSCYGLDS
eukprot:1137222-Pelagomonas_calceolata.AAC.22